MLRNQLCMLLKNLFVAEQNVSPNVRSIFTSSVKCREVVDRKEMLRSVPTSDEGTAGERAIDIDSAIYQQVDTFPTADTPNKLFNGVPYKDLPICNIKVSPNNTIISFTDAKGVPKLIRSCGIEGFKNTKKGTNIAAQATAISVGLRALEREVKTVRVRVRGLGPGRMSAIKGLKMSGLEIISITDNTRVSWNPPRPRKQKKL